MPSQPKEMVKFPEWFQFEKIGNHLIDQDDHDHHTKYVKTSSLTIQWFHESKRVNKKLKWLLRQRNKWTIFVLNCTSLTSPF